MQVNPAKIIRFYRSLALNHDFKESTRSRVQHDGLIRKDGHINATVAMRNPPGQADCVLDLAVIERHFRLAM